MTDDYAERTRLMTWRVAVLALAILVSGALAPLVVDAGRRRHPRPPLDGRVRRRAHRRRHARRLLRHPARADRRAPARASRRCARSSRVAAGNRPFRVLLICFVVQSAGIATMLAGVQYFADHVLHAPTTGRRCCSSAFVGPALLVMPLWTPGRRAGRQAARADRRASLLFAAGALALLAAPVLPPVAVYLIIARDRRAATPASRSSRWPCCRTASRTTRPAPAAGRPASSPALWTAGETFGLALGPGIFALVLAALRLRVVRPPARRRPSPRRARLGVLLGFTRAARPLLVGRGALLLRRYDLTAERLRPCRSRRVR